MFSNSTEWEIWSTNWCGTCIHDELGKAPEGTYCPIIEDIMMDVPNSRILKGGDYSTTICTSWSDKVDSNLKPVPEVPGQLELEI